LMTGSHSGSQTKFSKFKFSAAFSELLDLT